jgi:hypothetical protein
MSNLSQCHYDRPQSHTQTQTRWVIPGNKKIYAPSIKLLDLVITPNNPAYYASLVGAYGCVRRVQIKLDSKEVDVWYAQSVLPYLVSASADNEKQLNINSVIYGTGNNVKYDTATKKLSLYRPLVGPSVSLKLSVFSDLINSIGVINSDMEIIIDWDTNVAKYLLSANGSAVTSATISAPYLSYETLTGNWEQPPKVVYRQWLEDVFSVPAITTDNTSQQIEIRSNAFNNKNIGRMLLTNIPASIANVSTSSAVSADLTQLYNLFGYYMSVPMKQENFNIAKEGKNILTFRNVSNDAVKLSVAHDAWGPATFVTGGHYHSVAPVLKELSSATLNGFCSYGAVEINDLIRKELQITYKRTSDANTTIPALGNQLLVSAVAEIKCALVNGEKQYL